MLACGQEIAYHLERYCYKLLHINFDHWPVFRVGSTVMRIP
jgi:hypothetical protein